MKGFKVVYFDSSGSLSETLFGPPFSSVMDSMDDESCIRMIFSLAYPGCQIVSVSPCKIDF